MYTTIEADIINGRIRSAEGKKIPREAHVLITFLNEKKESALETGVAPSLRGVLKPYADSHLIGKEKTAWSKAAGKKHEAN